MMKSTGKSSNLCRNRVSNEESLLRSSGESVSNDVAVPSSFKSLYGQIHHLVENESNFVALLKQINDRVTAPIWRRCLPWGSSNQSDPSLNVRPSSHRQVVNSLFYTTPALLRIHDNFLKDLKSLDMKVLSIRQVVWIFYINIPELQGHIELMDKHISALATFEMLRYTDATFQSVYQEKVGNIVLSEYLIKPRERIWHYISFLENLMTRCLMLSNERDLKAINSCLEQLQELDQSITPFYDKIHELQRLATIQSSVIGLPKAFLCREQAIMAEGEFACIAVGNRQTAAAAIQFSTSRHESANICGQFDNHTLTHAWLLRDRVLLASKFGSDQFTYMTTVHLKDATACVRVINDAERIAKKTTMTPADVHCSVIYIFDKRGGIMMYAKNSQTFDAWRKALKISFSSQVAREHAYIEVDQLPDVSQE